MNQTLIEKKDDYLLSLDSKSKAIAKRLINFQPTTRLLLGYITELYNSEKSIRFRDTADFSMAYHPPITSQLEFLMARVFYHFIKKKGLKFKVSLRRQKNKCAPDIRIWAGDKTHAIIEIKAKASWMQGALSKARYKHYQSRLLKGESKSDPKKQNKEIQNTIQKYSKTFKIKKENIFILLPSLDGVHRQKDKTTLKDYYNSFSQTFKLPTRNFILLSKNLKLGLSSGNTLRKNYNETKRFETVFKRIFR